NRAALRRLTARPRRDGATERTVRAIVEGVRRGGDRALARFASRFDGLSGAIEVSREEMEAGAARAPVDGRRALRQAARHIAPVAFQQIPKHVDIGVAPGVAIEQRVEPLARLRSYLPRRPLPL